MKKIFVLVLISFLSFINFFQALETSAQVVIEEKVEINPQKFVNRDNPAFFFPDSIYDNPGNHIISNPNIQFDGPGSTITLPRAGRLQVTVYSFNAAEPSKFDLFLEQPSQLTILENANHNIGYAWCSEDYPANTNVEFGIHWLWNYYGMIYQGSEAGAQTTQLNANLYQIGFEAAGDDWDYNDLVILVEIIEMPSFDVTVYPEEITSGEEANFEIYLADCPPREIEVNLEIIEGQEYGSLVNPLTNEKTKIITNLELPVGLSWIYFLPEGVSVEETKIVIVRVGINEPSSQPKEDTIYIKPPPVYVYTIPDIVGANDTADVIIKHRLEDGTLEDFPPEQTFELAVLEGCVNGNFLVGEEINVYFADAQQPIKFVTADNLDEEFGKVLIRVGTFFGMIGRPVIGGNEEEITDKADNMNETNTRRAAFEKMISQKSTEMDKQKADFNRTDDEGTEPNPPGDVPIITACATDNPYYSPYWEGFTSVGDECDEWACDQNFDKYNGTIGIKDEAANYNSYNLCRYWNIVEGVGGFFPLFDKEKWYLGNGQLTEIKDKLIIPYQLDACYNTNTNENYWQFSIPENSISLRAIIDVCESNIGYEHIIHNLQELSIIPNENTCLALEDFEKQREYGPIASMYYIYEMAWEHEKVHKNDFYNRIKELLNYKFEYNNETFTYKEWLTTAFQPECSELVNTKSKAIYQAKKHHDEILKEFIIKLENEWNEFTHDGDDILHRKYEKNTQANPMVQWKIRQYKFELQKRPSEYWENCEFKEETE